MTERACRFHVTVKPAEIVYLNGLIDSYEGVGTMRTEDETMGKVTIYSTIGYELILKDLLLALQKEGLLLTVDGIDYDDKLI